VGKKYGNFCRGGGGNEPLGGLGRSSGHENIEWEGILTRKESLGTVCQGLLKANSEGGKIMGRGPDMSRGTLGKMWGG